VTSNLDNYFLYSIVAIGPEMQIINNS